MPTTRPRHFVTETDDLAVALDAAARRWPNVSRPKLVVRLAQLLASTELTMPDCCVLLAAEDAGATVASFDRRLAQSAADRNLPVLGL